MLYTRIYFHQLRVVVNQVQNFLPRKVVAPVEATVNLAHEFEVFGGVGFLDPEQDEQAVFDGAP